MQTITFDTCWLLRLRQAAQTTDMSIEAATALLIFDDDGSLMTRLREARSEYLSRGLPIACGPHSTEEFQDDARRAFTVFRRVWTALTSLPVSHPLHLLPIYSDEMLNTLLLELVTAVRIREWSAEPHDTGHFIYGGVEGIGKTTLLKAVAVAVAVLSARYFLVYVDYKELKQSHPTPTRIFVE